MFCLDERNFKDYHKGAKDCTIPICFTDYQINNLETSLGEYALIILNTTEFFRRLDKAFRKKNIKYTKKKISYNNGNHIERIKSIKEDNINIAFNKDCEFSYQQEFRILVLNNDVEDHLTVNIGDLQDISKIIPTKELVKYYFRYTFDFKECED